MCISDTQLLQHIVTEPETLTKKKNVVLLCGSTLVHILQVSYAHVNFCSDHQKQPLRRSLRWRKGHVVSVGLYLPLVVQTMIALCRNLTLSNSVALKGELSGKDY